MSTTPAELLSGDHHMNTPTTLTPTTLTPTRPPAAGARRDREAPTFASLAGRAQTALIATGLGARYLTISLTTKAVGIHGPAWTGRYPAGNFTREQAHDLADAFGVEDATDDDQGQQYATVSGRTRDGITVDVFYASAAEGDTRCG